MNSDRMKEIKELDGEIDRQFDDLLGLATANKEQLDQQSKQMDKIEHVTLNKIDNENKKSNWYVSGIKSTGSWIKNMFSTPTMKKTALPVDNRDRPAEGLKPDQSKISTLVEVCQGNNQTISEQDERLKRIEHRIGGQNSKVDKMNKDIKKII